MADFDLTEMGKQSRQAARELAKYTTSEKNQALQAMVQSLKNHQAEILKANQADLALADLAGITPALRDRLALDPARLEAIIQDLENVSRLKDPVGEVIEARDLPGGMKIRRQRTPLGVVGVIYEARPNVTVDIASLCLKTGNAVILRGGKETLQTNQALLNALQAALKAVDFPADAIQLIPSTERKYVAELLRLDHYVDMIIPRGGAELHQFCKENATIPVITGGIGVCHIYCDSFIDLELAVPIIYNAKVQRPTVCNALDTLLIHHSIAADLIPMVAEALAPVPVEIRADIQAYPYFEQANYPRLSHSSHADFGVEFLDYILSIRVVEDLDEALEHIYTYSSGHSDAILTLKPSHAERFLNEVDSACVYVNASTRFTDGAQFGLGAEVAVSTQKLHARGPMALEGLTTYKWLVEGKWNVRP